MEGKAVNTRIGVELTITEELKREGLMREIVRHVQAARKNAGLNVDDRILLSLRSDDEQLSKAIDEYKETIAAETLASIISDGQYSFESTGKIEDTELRIALEKQDN